jgi:hypothetical protein
LSLGDSRREGGLSVINVANGTCRKCLVSHLFQHISRDQVGCRTNVDVGLGPLKLGVCPGQVQDW